MRLALIASVAALIASLGNGAFAESLDDDDVYCYLQTDKNGKEHTVCEKVRDLRAVCDLTGGGNEECDAVAENRRPGLNLSGKKTSTRKRSMKLRQ